MTQKSNRGGLRNPPGGRPTNPNKKVPISFKLPPDLVALLRREPNATRLMESLLYQHYHKGASKMTTSQHHEQLSRILAALALLYAKQGEIYANWTPDKQVELEQVRSEIEALERQYEEAQK